jgi:hypothetical protein
LISIEVVCFDSYKIVYGANSGSESGGTNQLQNLHDRPKVLRRKTTSKGENAAALQKPTTAMSPLACPASNSASFEIDQL